MKKFFPFFFLLLLLFLVYHWDDKHRFDLILQGRSTLVFSLIPQDRRLVTFFIPEGNLIETIHGYGPYRIESIFKLGELAGWGGELLLGSLEEFLGLPLDGYLISDELDLKSNEEKETLKKIILKQVMETFKRKEKTNLSRWSLLRLWWQLTKVRVNKMVILSLEPSMSLQEQDLIINQFFQDERLVEEDLAVAVLNATNYPGLANRGARLIVNIGGRVVAVGDWEKEPTDLTVCQLKVSKKNFKTYTVQKIKKVFDCQWQGEDLAGYRAEVVVILGEDYWRKLNAKR